MSPSIKSVWGLALMLGALAACQGDPAPATATATSARSLSLVYSNNVEGETEPCG